MSDTSHSVAALPHLKPSGNRTVEGTGSLPADPLDVPLEVTPAWVLGASIEGGTRWLVVGEDGSTQAIEVSNGTATPRASPVDLPAGMPPVLVEDGVLSPPADAAPNSMALPVEGGTVYVDRAGGLRHTAGRAQPIDALPDARPVRHGNRIAVLAGATDRYAHGALGDEVEAGEVVVCSLPDLAVEARIEVDGVVEGIAPLLAPLTGRDEPDVIVTETDAERGARVVAYSLAGERLAAGPAIGKGFRWRHQLAVAPFAPDGVPELAVVKTPHIGGTVEFYRADGDDLTIAATVAGASSHAYGSRNLDGAVAGDFDGDGRVELLVPDDARTTLRGIRRTQTGASEAWSLPLGGRLTSNVHAVSGPNGLVVGAARDGALRLWG